MIKVQIFPKNDSFLNELVAFLLKKSPQFKRNFFIDNILKEKAPLSLKKYLIKSSPIGVEEVWGSTFQSHYRSDEQIYAISHNIISIEVSEEKYFANIVPSDYAEVIDFELGFLRPIYYKPKEENNDYLLATFDIDFHIINSAK
jgi:hypothetical protein